MTSAPSPRPTDTRVWFLDMGAALPALLTLEAETPRLSAADRERAGRFADSQVAQAWIGARVALRLVLERELGAGVRRIAFDVSSRGKPMLPDAPFAFSLSHSRQCALIATGPAGPLGVDVEGPRPVAMTGDRRAAIEAAGAALSSQPLPREGDARFLQAWVRLEALSKADGIGLARVLTQAGAFGPRRGQGMSTAILPDGIRVCDLALGHGLYAALATAMGDSGAVVGQLPVDADGLRSFAWG